MSRIHEFLDEAGVFFLATEDGEQAKVRPLGAHIDYEGKEYFTVGDFKAVYRQMSADPYVEIASFNPKNRTWLRYTGKAVFTENDEVRERILTALPHLRNVYNETTGNRMMIFSLEEAKAQIIDMAGNTEDIAL